MEFRKRALSILGPPLLATLAGCITENHYHFHNPEQVTIYENGDFKTESGEYGTVFEKPEPGSILTPENMP